MSTIWPQPHIAVFLQLLLPLLEHLRVHGGLSQAVREPSDRLSVGDAAALGQIKKLQKAAPIEQLIFQYLVGQVVELLKYQNFYHQQGRIRRTTAFGTRWPRRRTALPLANATKSASVLKPRSGSPSSSRLPRRSCSGNKLIRGFIIVALASRGLILEFLPSWPTWARF